MRANRHVDRYSSHPTARQGCPWVGSRLEIFQFLVGWVGSITAKVLKNLKGLC